METDNSIISLGETEKNFRHAAHLADTNGHVVITKDDKPQNILFDMESDPQIKRRTKRRSTMLQYGSLSGIFPLLKIFLNKSYTTERGEGHRRPSPCFICRFCYFCAANTLSAFLWLIFSMSSPLRCFSSACRISGIPLKSLNSRVLSIPSKSDPSARLSMPA